MAGSSVAAAGSQLHPVPSNQLPSNSTSESPLLTTTSSSDPMGDMMETKSTPNEEDLSPSDSVSNHGHDDGDEIFADAGLGSASAAVDGTLSESLCSAAEGKEYSESSEAGSMSSSTYEHGQEQFVTYKAKVIQLCHEIGYGEPSAIGRMKGGSFNRIIGLTFGSPEKKEYVLRIPRQPYDETQEYEISDQVGVLLYLAQFDSLKVPAILAYDTTTDNAINSQWVLQARLPGKPMQDIFYQLPVANRVQIAGEIAQLAIEMSKIKLPKPGRLSGSRCLPPSAIMPPTVTNTSFTGFKATEDLSLDKQPLAQVLAAQFDYFKQNEINSDHPNKTATQKMIDRWSTLQQIVSQMEMSGFMRIHDSDNILWHWDICARNILIDEVTEAEGHASEQNANAEDSTVNDTQITEGHQGSAVRSIAKGCQHSFQLSVGDVAGNGHKHTVQVKIGDGSGTCCKHKVEVTVEDNMGKKYLHTLEIKSSQETEDSGTQETASALAKHSDLSQPPTPPHQRKWVVSGVLDWDDALSVPSVLAGYQYSWLWCDEEDRSSHWAYDRDTSPERLLTADQLLVKATFDQIVARACPNFIEDAYGRGIWLRRLARFGIYGFHDSEDFARYEQFVKDWQEYYVSLSGNSVDV
ncbi:hypothetical protein IFR04_002715 [Cadophora malorum]|uniref:Aminoglycoside phosphotransferase domain-containing protein n=1 Tax=Cadophora malorum TaxID=108018 RepID=A0A8H8BU71_9HELO|nr:hypothetical protein IFR04_002715 [Cadophora malorum]